MGQLHCSSLNNYVTSGFPLLPSHTAEAASANKYSIIFSLTSQKSGDEIYPKIIITISKHRKHFFPSKHQVGYAMSVYQKYCQQLSDVKEKSHTCVAVMDSTHLSNSSQ